MELPVEIYSVDSVRRIDRAAIDDYGIGGHTLMTRAGAAAVDAASARFPDSKRWQVICGGGNNGGDGYVVARLAAERGLSVSVLAMTPPEKLTGDAATAHTDYATQVGAVARFAGALDPEADLLVDGLLGSGLERPLEGAFANVAEAINAHRAPVLALDIPSGLHGDSGAVMGIAVLADLTITFVGLKSGLFLGNGADHCGEVAFADLDIPAQCRADQTPVLRRIDDRTIACALPSRRRSTHKGDFGHVLVIGGGRGMPGAVCLCGEAALRAGAGLVSIATHPDHSRFLSASRPELMCHAIETSDQLTPLLAKATVIAVGPGLGTDDWASDMLAAVLDSSLSIVADADALNLIAGSDRQHDDIILTPHPGEAARLLGWTTADVQANRRDALAGIAGKYGATVVLKGSGTLVSSANDPSWVCSAGNPGMASAGMGDVLTGIIAALRAQGLSSEPSAVAGVQVHARAGDTAAAVGERGMIASDLLAEIRNWVNH